MEFVQVRHPDVEVTALVPASSLENHQERGWKRADDDLKSLTKADLQALASQKGVTVNPNANKDELIQAVAAADATPPA